MVIDITTKSFEEAVADLEVATREAIHEYQMGCLMDKYTFLQENGVVMEEAEEVEASKGRLKTMIDKFIAAVKKVWDTVVKKIKDWYNAVAGKISDVKEKAAAKKKADDAEKKAGNIFNRFKEKIASIKDEHEGKKLVDTTSDEFAEFVKAFNESHKVMA